MSVGYSESRREAPRRNSYGICRGTRHRFSIVRNSVRSVLIQTTDFALPPSKENFVKVHFIALLAIAFCVVTITSTKAEEKKKVLFLSGGPSHGYAEHEHVAGCMLLSKRINESGLPIESTVIKGWPSDPKAFDGVAAIVMYCDGGGGHLMINKGMVRPDFLELVKKGVGVGASTTRWKCRRAMRVMRCSRQSADISKRSFR
jgi:hypothetical protein